LGLWRQKKGDTDAELVSATSGGDRAALAKLYDRYATTAYGLAVRLVGPAAAEDVVHDSFVALVDRPGTFDPAKGSFRAWFLTSVHRRCLTQLRERSRLTDDAALGEVPDADPEPVDVVVQRLQSSSVRAALADLPFAQREVLVLAYYQGLSQSELATRLGVPLGTVKARARRGLLALRSLLHGEAGQSDEGEKT
jgi:RNA polymerase sigma-70 factor (ECF subfamily)